MNPWLVLTTTDHLEQFLNESIINRVLELNAQRDDQLAIRIANAVGRLFR